MLRAIRLSTPTDYLLYGSIIGALDSVVKYNYCMHGCSVYDMSWAAIPCAKACEIPIILYSVESLVQNPTFGKL